MKLLERIFGPPMAAPETQSMRRLRMTFIAWACASALGVSATDAISSLCGRAAAGGMLLALLLLTGVTGSLFFYRKTRIDDAWFTARGFNPDRKEP
jgi:hypothetical protein